METTRCFGIEDHAAVSGRALAIWTMHRDALATSAAAQVERIARDAIGRPLSGSGAGTP